MTTGILAGVVSSIVLQPFEVAKTRMQTRADSSNLARVMTRIWYTEGPGGLWAGTLPSVVRLAGGLALYFLFLGELQAVLLSRAGPLVGSAAAAADFVMGGLSRGLAATVFCPVTVLKTRAEEGLRSDGGGLLSQLLLLSRQEGMGGLFAGLGPTLLQDVPYAGISLLVLRQLRHHLDGIPYMPPSLLGGLCGAVSAFCATMITQPADVVRTEVVLGGTKGKRLGAMSVVTRLVQTRGPLVLFAGSTARLVRRMLMQAFTWAAYEIVLVQRSGS